MIIWLHPNQFDILDRRCRQELGYGLREFYSPNEVRIIEPILSDDSPWARVWRWLCR